MKIRDRITLTLDTLIVLVCLFGLFVVFGAGLSSCGISSERTEQVVEREDLVAGPMVVETPIGNFVMHPTKVSRFRTQDTRENTKNEIKAPEYREIGGAILGGLTGPLAGGGMVGLLAAWFLRRQSSKAAEEKRELEEERRRVERQRNELIDGVEASKRRLEAVRLDERTTAWDALTADLERKQSRDTVEAVKERVG